MLFDFLELFLDGQELESWRERVRRGGADAPGIRTPEAAPGRGHRGHLRTGARSARGVAGRSRPRWTASWPKGAEKARERATAVRDRAYLGLRAALSPRADTAPPFGGWVGESMRSRAVVPGPSPEGSVSSNHHETAHLALARIARCMRVRHLRGTGLHGRSSVENPDSRHRRSWPWTREFMESAVLVAGGGPDRRPARFADAPLRSCARIPRSTPTAPAQCPRGSCRRRQVKTVGAGQPDPLQPGQPDHCRGAPADRARATRRGAGARGRPGRCLLEADQQRERAPRRAARAGRTPAAASVATVRGPIAIVPGCEPRGCPSSLLLATGLWASCGALRFVAP